MWFDGEAKVKRSNRRDWVKFVVCLAGALLLIALYSWSQQPHTGYERDPEVARVQSLRNCAELQEIFNESVGYHRFFTEHPDDAGNGRDGRGARFHMARLTAADDRMQDIGCYR